MLFVQIINIFKIDDDEERTVAQNFDSFVTPMSKPPNENWYKNYDRIFNKGENKNGNG